MITVLLGALAPGRRSRQEPRQHPYTVCGRQVDVAHGAGWVEVWECGLADPGVLARAGLASHGGLALGLGLDRLLMLRKGIPDIRLLRSADPRHQPDAGPGSLPAGVGYAGGPPGPVRRRRPGR
jgi:phenylalanyl-tRNA synthetase alpha chain